MGFVRTENAFAKADQSPRRRYSAAVGMSEYASGDWTAEFVFRRAGKAMYENKTQIKKDHGA